VSLIVANAIDQWRELRAEYELVLEAAYRRAEDECNGRLLNAAGREKGIDPYSLFMGNDARARCYASPELLDHWARYPRLTFARFERQSVWR
jgi:hypothetical protein